MAINGREGEGWRRTKSERETGKNGEEEREGECERDRKSMSMRAEAR